MSRSFKVAKDYYDADAKIFNKGTVTIEPGVTILVGCNGTGKSTLINHIRRELEMNKIPHIHFNNLTDGGHTAMDAAAFVGNMSFVLDCAFKSEGEVIHINISRIANKCGNLMSYAIAKGYKEIWLLVDALDSGFSIDNIIDVKDNLFNVMIEDGKSKGIDVYIVAAANSYEMVRDQNCYDVYHCKYVTFKTYNSYRKFILKSREIKDKRYK